MTREDLIELAQKVLETKKKYPKMWLDMSFTLFQDGNFCVYLSADNNKLKSTKRFSYFSTDKKTTIEDVKRKFDEIVYEALNIDILSEKQKELERLQKEIEELKNESNQ